MKIIQVLRLIAFVLLISAPKFVVASKNNGTVPLILTIPNNEHTASSAIIHIRASIIMPQGVEISKVVGTDNLKLSEGPITLRTNSRNDGKVDVDIIIRTAFHATKFRPFSSEPVIRLEVGVLNFITVDNISGVFQNGAGAGGGHNHASLQDISIVIDDEMNDGSETDNDITNGSSLDFGTFQLSETNSIQTVKNQFTDITLYPNPVNGSVLNINSKSEIVGLTEIVIHNALGNLVKKQNALQIMNESNIQINVDDLSSGIYFLTISNASGKNVKKFTVAH